MQLDVSLAIEQYKNNYNIFSEICNKTEVHLKELLKAKNIKYHSISSRVKEEDKLKNKLLKSASKYASLLDVTDISGLRIITYFEDEIDVVANIMKENFAIDFDNSIDKRETLAPNTFGYLSLHYIASYSEYINSIPPIFSYDNIRFEIQIRSILQHGWAEIEHDLGYKSEIEVPYEVRRQFSRIASLLELADSEFINIRETLNIYEKTVKDYISISKKDIYINKLSLSTFLNESSVSRQLDSLISKKVKSKLIFNVDFVPVLLKILFFHHINFTDNISEEITKHKQLIIQFCGKWLETKVVEESNIGIGIWFLGLVKTLEQYSEDSLMNYMNYVGIGIPSERNGLIKDLMFVFEKIGKKTK